jgi:hypothetical protein
LQIIFGENIPMGLTKVSVVTILSVALIIYCVGEIHCIKKTPNPSPKHTGSSGTGRSKSNTVNDDSSSSYSNEKYPNRKDFDYRERDVSRHLVARFSRYIRFGGIIQRISAETNVPRDKVVIGGPSQYQDQRSHRGRDIHAAHVVRVGKIDGRLRGSKQHTELQNFLGHTQNVARYANVGGVGADIDKFQSNYLGVLARINFGGILTQKDEGTLIKLRKEFIDILDKHIKKGKLSEEGKQELKTAKAVVNYIKIGELFQKGKDGYEGKGMDRYE